MNYDLIYCDPPWEYGNTISNGAACNHYGTMGIEDLKRLPVWSLAAEMRFWRCGIPAHITVKQLPLLSPGALRSAP